MAKKNNALNSMRTALVAEGKNDTERVPASGVFRNPADSMKRTTVYIPEDLHRRFKIQAIKEGKSVSSIVVDLIHDYLGDERR